VATGAAQDDISFQGKQISVVVGFDVGGAYDAYARLLAAHLGKQLLGKPTPIVRNMAGAGSLRAANFIYGIAPKDGLTIGTFSRTLPLAPLFGQAQFDSRKFTWLGSVASDIVVCMVSDRSNISSWGDFESKPTNLGSTGPASEPAIYARFLKNVLGVPIVLIGGYQGTADLFLAMERGEIDGACGISWSTIKLFRQDLLAAKKLKIVLQAGLSKSDQLSTVQSLDELLTSESQRQALSLILATLSVSRPFAAPPEIPDAARAALVRGFEQTMKDPDFLSDARKQNLDVGLVTAAVIMQRLNAVYALPKDVIEAASRSIFN
jgi:tripartite-type tricarboxylate transporter receptor subunit TctC